jgi:DNA-binding protein H-NS
MTPYRNLEPLEARIEELGRQVAELRLQAEAVQAANRAEAIAFVRAKMKEHEITLRDVGLRVWTGSSGTPRLHARDAWPFPGLQDEESPETYQVTSMSDPASDPTFCQTGYMSTLESLTAQIADHERQVAALRAQAESIRAAELSGVIAEIRAKVQEYEISAKDLGLKTNGKGPVAKPAARYFNPNGPESWSGLGRKPHWVSSALAEGSTLDSLQRPST